jgi:rSAM/selenodomain-associated transferase 1
MTASPSAGRGTRVVVFAKSPQPGVAKTRLIPALGAQGAASLARRMLAHTLEQALAAKLGPVELCMSPGPEDPMWADVAIPDTIERSAQGDGDLGQRMTRAVERVSTSHGENVILVGTDCPSLSVDQLTEAAKMLAQYDVVILPASDGGYVLLGMKEPHPEIFTNMPWSTSAVAALTLGRLSKLGMRVWQGQTMHDIDEPADLVQLPATFLHKDFKFRYQEQLIRGLSV